MLRCLPLRCRLDNDAQAAVSVSRWCHRVGRLRTCARDRANLRQLIPGRRHVAAAAISPFRALRDEVRRLHEAPLVEIFVECSLEELVRRDTKGL